MHAPMMVQSVHPSSAQISPNMAYNTQINNAIPMNEPPANTYAEVAPNVSNNLGAFTLHPNPQVQNSYQDYQPNHVLGYSHGHSASLSSISTASLKGGSPAPSLSGSDDSGNTSKSTLLQRSTGLVRSNPSSRRGSVSSVVSNAGTPYAGSKKDGDKKFVCSYPGCDRAFSRNFNLSTHYVSGKLPLPSLSMPCHPKRSLLISLIFVLAFRIRILASNHSHALIALNPSLADMTALVT